MSGFHPVRAAAYPHPLRVIRTQRKHLWESTPATTALLYKGADGRTHKHGLRPAPKPAGVWDELPGSYYTIEEVATALIDLARGTT